MNIKITYAEAQKRYPNIVPEIAAKVAKAKNKVYLSSLKWSFDWGVRIGMYSSGQFLDILKGNKPSLPLEKTEDEEIQEYESMCIMYLKAGKYKSDTRITTLPKEVEDQQRRFIRKDRAEKARIKGLTSQQRDSETQEALNKLRGTPGFTEFHL